MTWLRQFTSRDWLLAIVFFGSAFLAAAVLIQVSACSLCMTQRYFMACGVVTIAIALLHQRVPLIYPVLAALFWVAGCLVAFRQLWIMYVPGAATNCGPGIDFLIANEYPLSSIVRTMLMGSGDCAEPSVIPLLALAGLLILLTMLFLHVRSRKSV
ncbi:MAG: disulfide bond formation protein B [Gammaproteobacteria bacterium]|nr:disulfide bond formation protein B [Gammaproteobacteria bacterium]